VVTAGQTTVLGRGRIFNVLQASSPISVVADRRSNAGGQTLNRVFNSIPAGSKFTAKDGEEWTYLRITSALTQTITIFVGDDDMQFNNAVTVTGTAVVSVSPSNTLNCSADKTLAANSTDAASIPANAARRRVTIGLLSSSAATKIRVSDTGATTRGFEIQAGTFTEFDTTAALGIRNDTAAIATYYIVEEV
jgi:hypothetical protein